MPEFIFVSYSRADLPFTKALVADLKRNGFEVWIDLLCLRGGDDWGGSIRGAIERCAAVVVVVSRTSADSPAVAAEIDAARTLSKPIVPVILSDRHVPDPLREYHWVDARFSFRECRHQLVRTLRGEPLQRDLSAPTFGQRAWLLHERFAPFGIRTAARTAFAMSLLRTLLFGLFLAVRWGHTEWFTQVATYVFIYLAIQFYATFLAMRLASRRVSKRRVVQWYMTQVLCAPFLFVLARDWAVWTPLGGDLQYFASWSLALAAPEAAVLVYLLISPTVSRWCIDLARE